MAVVRFTRHLARFFPDLVVDGVHVDARDAAGVVAALDARHAGLASFLVDDQGALRRHVNLFIDGEPVRDRRSLTDPVRGASEVFVLQALSGG